MNRLSSQRDVEPIAQHLFTYKPVRKNEHGDISLCLTEEGSFVAQVKSKGELFQIPVNGLPRQVQDSADKVKRYCSLTYCTLERRSGEWVSACIKESLPGGAIGQEEILPIHPGYSMGSLIHKNELLRQVKLRQLSNFTDELDSINENFDPTDVTLSFEKNRIIKKIETLGKEIADLDLPDDQIKETLPIDEQKTKYSVVNRAYPKEIIRHIVIESSQKEEIVSKIQSLAQQVFSNQIAMNCLPKGTLEDVAKNIEGMLATNKQVFLVASYINLSKARLLNPIVVRKDEMSEELIERQEEYYILTESILGGMFLGYGCSLSDHEELKREAPLAEKKSILSKISMISVVSLGAIPAMNEDAHNVNLWNVYCKWKNTLTQDKWAGYPIGFGYRKLSSILREK